MALPSTLRSRNSCSMTEFRIKCLTHAHSRARPVSSLTSSGYGLPPTVTIPTRRLINIKRPSRLEPRIFLTGTRSLTTRSPTFYRLSYGTDARSENGMFQPFFSFIVNMSASERLYSVCHRSALKSLGWSASWSAYLNTDT